MGLKWLSIFFSSRITLTCRPFRYWRRKVFLKDDICRNHYDWHAVVFFSNTKLTAPNVKYLNTPWPWTKCAKNAKLHHLKCEIFTDLSHFLLKICLGFLVKMTNISNTIPIPQWKEIVNTSNCVYSVPWITITKIILCHILLSRCIVRFPTPVIRNS